MKIKHRLKAAFTAAFSLLVLTLTSLTASAWTGIGAGSGTSSQAYTPFSILKKNDTFAWRADLPRFSAYIRIVKRFNNFKRNATPKCATSI